MPVKGIARQAWELALKLDGKEKPKPTDLLVKTILPNGKRVNFNESKQHRTEPAPMDYSLRAFLSLMFRGKPHLKIELFKHPVQRVQFKNVLSHLEVKQIAIPSGGHLQKDHMVDVFVGVDEKQSGPSGLHGVHVYCEGTLIVSYALHLLNLKVENGDHFGTVLIVDFPKDSSVKPTNNKIDMHWNQDKAVWGALKNVFETYVDARRRARDQKFPYRKQFFAVVSELKSMFKEAYGVSDRGPRAGPVVGVLRLPPKEEDSNSYFPVIKKYLGSSPPECTCAAAGPPPPLPLLPPPLIARDEGRLPPPTSTESTWFVFESHTSSHPR